MNTPQPAAFKTGTWAGLVAGDNLKHRGTHAAVLRADGSLVCLCGPKGKTASANARMLASLLNTASEQGIESASLN